ncbi:MAG: serine racemase VanT catalytic subunit [Lachnospiraceae bacterium]|nr:serine racemase VanT catalytic subunit [Lachnospiraceae bacterium]
MPRNISPGGAAAFRGGLDRFRLLAAFLVIAIHVSPLSAISPEADFFLTRVLARLAVPFFFLVTGYFVLGEDSHSLFPSRLRRFLLKTSLLYLFSVVLYLPFGIYAGHYRGLTAGGFLRMVFFDGTFYHLWYFPACILGVFLAALLMRFLSWPMAAWAAALLYLIGLSGDSYYGLVASVPPLKAIYEGLFQVSSYTRNGLFFAPLFLVLGAGLSRESSLGQIKDRRRTLLGFIFSFALMTLEAFLLRHFETPRHDSMYLFLAPSMFFLFRLALCVNQPSSKRLRNISAWIYILHPAVLIALRMAAKPLHLTWLLVENPLVQYLSVSLLTSAAAFAATVLLSKAAALLSRPRKEAAPSVSGRRAWIELDRRALLHNVEYLRGLAPGGCRLMPAVKANAYGHGALLLAKELNRLGIDSFCVACAAEGAKLRRQGITGEILILGYTHPSQFSLLSRFCLTQTVVDVSYGELLNSFGQKIHVHVGIDTGMHRLGEPSENLKGLQSLWHMENLILDGIFTHLCTCDGQTEREESYVKKQTAAFFRCVEGLEMQGCPCPKIHLLSSYGLLKYPELSSDYVRAGIALYGVLSTREDTKTLGALLQPILSLKARITAVKNLNPGESVGYGITYTAEKERTLAILAIGYADGLPRSFSCGTGSVLINGRRAPILGRICMDQTIVDVTGIPAVVAGGYAVLIGSWGEEQITACDWAELSGTITNEILSRLGGRLERIWGEDERLDL